MSNVDGLYRTIIFFFFFIEEEEDERFPNLKGINVMIIKLYTVSK